MKTAIRFKLWAVAFAMLMACASVSQAAGTYRVSEVIRVLSPVSFECRLDDFPYAPQARFQVFLEDAMPVEERATEAIAALGRVLRSAGKIEVRIGRIRNYFRVEAQVLADSTDVAERLAAENYLRRGQAETVLSSDVQNAGIRPETRPVPEAETEIPAVRARPAGYSLQQLMRTKVDLSLLRAETPFAEALEIISDSVEPRLPIVVFWGDIESNAFVYKETPIGVEGFGQISAAMGLDAVLYSVSSYGAPVRFTIEGGILKIGTLASLSQRNTKAYSVVDLLAAPSQDMSQGGYGSGAGGSGTSGYSGAR